MNAQKLRGREERNIARIFSMTALFIFLIFLPLQADTIWTEGYHEINDGDVYTEIWMYNDATADMFGGDVFKLELFDITMVSIFDGELTDLRLHDNSIGDLYGGDLNRLGISENGLLNLYAYDVTYHETGGYYDRGWIEGKYINNDLYFSFDFVEPDTFLHINLIPEPSTLLLFGLGVLLLKKRT